MARLHYTLLKATLDADIDTDDTTVTFTAPLREYGADNIDTITAPDILVLRAGYEILHVTAYTSGALSATVLRGCEDSVATSHEEGDVFRHVLTAVDADAGGGGGSGVVETIVAGTGITVDDTDPANPIVASTADSSLDWVSVLAHGATGDGTTDDTTAIQAALDATPEGGVCYFPVPAVDYKISSALTVPHGMRLTGDGGFIGQYTKVRQATANTTAIVGPTGVSEHFVVEGLQITGTIGGQTDGAAISASTSVLVSRCLMQGFRDGLLVTVDNVSLDTPYYCDADRSFFDSATRAGVRLAGIVNNFTWQSCRANGNGTGVQVVGGPYGLRFFGGAIEGNTIGLDIDGNDTLTGFDTAAVLVSGTYFEQADEMTDIRLGNGSEVRSVRIEACPFIKPGLTGDGWHILAPDVDGLTITDCEFSSTQAVDATGSTGVVYGRNHNLNAGTVTLPSGSIRLDSANVTPEPVGAVAAVGTSHYFARADHVHEGDGGGGGGTPVADGCRLTKSANQSIADSASDAVTFDGEAFDTDAFHDNSTNPARITIPTGKGGQYLIGGAIQWDEGATGALLRLRVNGTTDVPGGDRGTRDAMQVTTCLALAAGDYVEMVAQNNHGSARNVRGTGGASQVSASFWCTRVGS